MERWNVHTTNVLSTVHELTKTLTLLFIYLWLRE